MKIALKAKEKNRAGNTEHPFFKTPDRYYLSSLILIICVLPLYLAASGSLGLKSLFLLVLMCLIGMTTEILGALMTKRPIHYFGISSWIISPLLLPPGTTVWMAVICFVFALIICQILFGGFGKHLFHPAVIAQVFLMINFARLYNSSFLKPFSSTTFGFSVYSSQSYTIKTTITLLKGAEEISLEALLFGPNIGLIGEIFPFLIIICGGLYLLLGDTDYRTPLAFMASLFLFSFIGNRYISSNIISVIPTFLGGGSLFYAFFIFSDRWTSARTKGGRIIAGITAAFLTVIIRSYSSNIEGIMFAAIFNYSFSPLYDEFIMNLHKQKKSPV
jgi:Na+-translocating ferredoxin:NAD+ oxidoreductase RnfD subunit